MKESQLKEGIQIKIIDRLSSLRDKNDILGRYIKDYISDDDEEGGKDDRIFFNCVVLFSGEDIGFSEVVVFIKDRIAAEIRKLEKKFKEL